MARAAHVGIRVDQRRDTAMRPGGEVTKSEYAADLSFGLSEQCLREDLEEELVRYMRAAGEAPTVRAIAAAIARVIAEDHIAMAELLAQAGRRLTSS
jgi:hypothetical protein